jgi:hypothetical protein
MLPETRHMTPEEPSSSGKSATWKLVDAIEALTGSGWNQEKRGEVADLIRAYRFDQTSAVVARIQKLIRESGNVELSEKVYTGKYY